ncbi:MAG TPA: hypothetical protein VHE30_26280, partial [Polyangiaceae bacterium]|nr:hypothetical protein [Polyangiaceae bacterium]
MTAVADEPVSARVAREPLSRTLFGVDWSARLPIELAPGIVAEASSYDRALPFIAAHYAEIFQETPDSPFATRVAAKKERYYRLAADFFEFKEGRRTVGLFVCNAVDWSTYYIRSAA